MQYIQTWSHTYKVKCERTMCLLEYMKLVRRKIGSYCPQQLKCSSWSSAGHDTMKVVKQSCTSNGAKHWAKYISTHMCIYEFICVHTYCRPCKVRSHCIAHFCHNYKNHEFSISHSPPFRQPKPPGRQPASRLCAQLSTRYGGTYTYLCPSIHIYIRM